MQDKPMSKCTQNNKLFGQNESGWTMIKSKYHVYVWYGYALFADILWTGQQTGYKTSDIQGKVTTVCS